MRRHGLRPNLRVHLHEGLRLKLQVSTKPARDPEVYPMIRIFLVSLLGCMGFQTAVVIQSSLSVHKFNACRKFSAFRIDNSCAQSSPVRFMRKNSLMPLLSTPNKESSGGYVILRDLLGGMPVLGGYSSFSELFAKFDKELSGKISLQELQSTLKEMGATITNQQVINCTIFKVSSVNSSFYLPIYFPCLLLKSRRKNCFAPWIHQEMVRSTGPSSWQPSSKSRTITTTGSSRLRFFCLFFPSSPVKPTFVRLYHDPVALQYLEQPRHARRRFLEAAWMRYPR
jgi:hypothetical protein